MHVPTYVSSFTPAETALKMPRAKNNWQTPPSQVTEVNVVYHMLITLK